MTAVTIPDADTILGALRLALPGIEVHEKAVRAAIQEATGLARWPVDEPAAIFFAFGSRPRAVPALNAKLAPFLAREQALSHGLTLDVTPDELRGLLTDIRSRVLSYDDVRAWFAARLPVD